jgi:hypothetical protein
VDCTEVFYTRLWLQSSGVLLWTVLKNFIDVCGCSLHVYCSGLYWSLLYTFGVLYSVVLRWTVLKSFIHVCGCSLHVYCSGLYLRILYTFVGAVFMCTAVDCTEDFYTRLWVPSSCVLRWTILKTFIKVCGCRLHVYCGGLYWRHLYTLGREFLRCSVVECTEEFYTL